MVKKTRQGQVTVDADTREPHDGILLLHHHPARHSCSMSLCLQHASSPARPIRITQKGQNGQASRQLVVVCTVQVSQPCLLQFLLPLGYLTWPTDVDSRPPTSLVAGRRRMTLCAGTPLRTMRCTFACASNKTFDFECSGPGGAALYQRCFLVRIQVLNLEPWNVHQKK